jgi:hypothetical protein
MGRYQFELATRADDQELRTILSQIPMPGRISICFQREPSFLDAASVEGDFVQTIVCRDQERRRIVGFGTRSIRHRYVDGVAMPVGYLSSLRVLPEYRSIGLIARGYAYFRELHEDGRASFYLTTIAAGNETAIRVLTSARAGLPHYHPQGDYHTLAIPIRTRRRSGSPCESDEIRSATSNDLPAIVRFVNEEGEKRQWYPRFNADDFRTSGGLLRALQTSDILLAERRGDLVETLAVWDQHSFRQSVVNRYDTALKYARPVYNLLATLRRTAKLPRRGDPFRYVLGALCLIRNDDTSVFQSLLAASLARTAKGPADYLLLGMHESDPLVPLASRLAAQSYVTHLYAVAFGRDNAPKGIALRPVHLEIGTL